MSALRVHRGTAPLAAELRGSVLALGNFDGMHRGHQHLIETAKTQAAAGGHRSAVLTFEPHPRAFFAPHEPVFTLTPAAAKLKLLAAFGADLAVVRPFDAELAAMSASEFVRRLLSEELGVSGVVVGSDFHFGRGREGTPAVLGALARDAGLTCTVLPPVLDSGEPISSSRIRRALRDGDIRLANRLLGYRWFVDGEVRHGAKLGRTLGFPTANLQLGPGSEVRHGIYAVRACVERGQALDGVASFGRRPTFDDGAPLLETFLFDFAGDLYGRTMEVEFVDWIRGEERFPSAEALVERMRLDAEEARASLAAAAGVSMIGR